MGCEWSRCVREAWGWCEGGVPWGVREESLEGSMGCEGEERGYRWGEGKSGAREGERFQGSWHTSPETRW